jgi:hypothetical protein
MQIPVQDIAFFSILWCHVADHPLGDLAMFGYRTTMKVEIDWNPSISWLLDWTMCRKMVVLEFKDKIMTFEHNIFFEKRYFSRWREFTTKNRAELKPLNDTYHLKIFICDH